MHIPDENTFIKRSWEYITKNDAPGRSYSRDMIDDIDKELIRIRQQILKGEVPKELLPSEWQSFIRYVCKSARNLPEWW